MWKWAIVLAVGAAVGCDNSNTDGAKGAQDSSPQSEAVGEVTAPAGSVSTPGSYSGPGTPTDYSTTRPNEVAASAVIEGQDQAGAAAQAVGDQGAQVQSKIDEALQYVKEKKYDLAEKALDALDKQRTGWSAATQQAYGPKIDMARKALTAAKGGGSGALDALRGSLPGGTSK